MADKLQIIQGKEEAIFQLAKEGQNDEAKKQLVQLVFACAKNRDFTNAERLRDRIYEIDPMALREIIHTGEFIDEQKSSSINNDDQHTWANLIELLTPEEFSSIYHELEEREFSAEETVVNQGEENDELFFINSGGVRLWYTKNDREMLIKELQQGEIAGENFFEPSFWTLSITTTTTSKISALKHEKLDLWKEKLPGLESKLRDFYNRYNDISSVLKQKKQDRRTYTRFTLNPRILIQILNKSGQPLGKSFRGEMADISHGGISFICRINKKENCRLLLGRYLRIIIPLGELDNTIDVSGQVIAVQPYSLIEHDYSIHLKFDKLLDHSSLRSITK